MNHIRLYFVATLSCVIFGLAVADLDIQIGYDSRNDIPNMENVRRAIVNDHPHWVDGQWQVEAGLDHAASWERQKTLMGWQ